MSRVTPEHVDARTRAIRDAALALFARRGIAQTTMQEVAAEAGLSPGAIYRYFPSKEQLLQEVFAWCEEQDRVLFQEVRADARSPFEALFSLGRLIFEDMRNPESRPTFLMQLEAALAAARGPESVAAPHTQLLETIRGRYVELVGQAQQADEIAADVDPEALVLILMASVQGLRLFTIELSQPPDTGAIFELLARMVRSLGHQRDKEAS